MIVEFDRIYADLVCEDVPRVPLRSPDDRGGGDARADHVTDPWDGEKPYARDGFVATYCLGSRD